jgi:general secretion pathway protein L
VSASASLLGFLSLSRPIDDVATGLSRLRAALRRGRAIDLIEQADGSFVATAWRKGAAEPIDEPPLRIDHDQFSPPPSPRLRKLLAGSRVSAVLAPSRFVFRPLELPRAAGPFLEAVVRTQIDRLSPWNASDAVFGWSAPLDVGSGRIAVTVAATARAQVAPISQALSARRVASIEISTRAGEGGTLVIPVVVPQMGDADGARRLRYGLVVGLGVGCLAFVASMVLWVALGGAYDARLAQLQTEIAQRRTVLASQGGSASEQALRALHARKRATPSAVMILEALAKALPDDSHLTELHIEDGKVQMTGLAGDASQLISLIEQSQQFTRAIFFAPTVRGPNGGEIFHIEAHLEPSFGGIN